MSNLNRQTSRASMDDILSSIRRIIDESVPDQPVVGSTSEAKKAELDADRASSARAQSITKEPVAQTGDAARSAPSVIPASPVVRQPVKEPSVPHFDERFTEDDAEAFREVAQVLQSTASMLNGGAAADSATPSKPSPSAASEPDIRLEPEFVQAEPETTVDPAASAQGQGKAETAEVSSGFEIATDDIVPLVSNAASRSIAENFLALDEVLRERTGEDLKSTTEQLLKPMLADWLDENLPSMVERLVRQEIERIARGEPRAA
ncbi:MAG: DUF2497 domain-containing protein [Pseudomonadota bacterium]